MATVGQSLTAPEAGWKRYDDRDGCFKFQGSWTDYAHTSHYQGSHKATTVQNDKIIFKFFGTKIRVIGFRYTDHSTNVEIKIDGVAEKYSQYGTLQFQTILYEKTNLSSGEHFVEITKLDASGSNAYCSIDAVDIDDTGRLLHPDEVLDPKDLDIGKRIRCHYQASSGQVGTFSGLGQETSDFIPPASSATPNGDFYWICCDIKNGKKILLADRNIQHSISWDKINEQGMTNTGREITF